MYVFFSVKQINKNEAKYYEDIVSYSKEKLMLYPYHLSDKVVRGLRITPFEYYSSILGNKKYLIYLNFYNLLLHYLFAEKTMEHEKSYDSLPNFTAADCN